MSKWSPIGTSCNCFAPEVWQDLEGTIVDRFTEIEKAYKAMGWKAMWIRKGVSNRSILNFLAWRKRNLLRYLFLTLSPASSMVSPCLSNSHQRGMRMMNMTLQFRQECIQINLWFLILMMPIFWSLSLAASSFSWMLGQIVGRIFANLLNLIRCSKTCVQSGAANALRGEHGAGRLELTGNALQVKEKDSGQHSILLILSSSWVVL